MRKPLIILLILISGIGSSVAQLQKHIEFSRSNFPGRSAAFNIAFRQYKEGKKIFERLEKTGTGSYEPVELLLQSAYNFNPNHAALTYMLGVSRYHTRHYKDADKYLGQSLNIDQPHDSMLYYYLGLTEHVIMKYDSAIVHLDYFIDKFSAPRIRDSIAGKRMEESRYGAILVQNPVHTKSESLGTTINTSFNEFFPIIGHDGTYVIFNRLEPDSLITGKFHERIYISSAVDSGWGAPQRLPMQNLYGKEFNALSLSSDGTRMLLRGKDKDGRYDLYEAELGVRGWTSPTLLNSTINTVHDEIFATYVDHDSAIYFISDRHQGFGGFDIWKAKRISSSQWEKPVNLGNTINTKYNEMYVSHPADSTVIYFTSDGHSTIGYTDLFRARLDEGKWRKPVNLGYPVNSSLEDEQFMVLPSGMLGLSVRYAGNQTDIIKTFLPPKAKKPALIIEERFLSNFPMIETYTIIPKDE